MFPDTDPALRGKDSGEMLAAAYARVQAEGWELCNLDCVVLAERPKLLPHREAICQRIAELLGVSPAAIAVKGKTGERSGEIGQGRIMQAICNCLIQRR